MPGGLVATALGVGPPVVESPVEPFDLAIRLGPVGPGPFGCDAQVRACIPPGVGAIGGAVVGDRPLDG